MFQEVLFYVWYVCNNNKENLKVRIDEIIKVIKGRQEALAEFDEGIFNALVEKIDIISPTHFVFELKSGVRVDG